MTLLTLVRHGRTEWNDQRRYQGWSDIPLSARGRDEARRLGDALATEPFAVVITSDLSRAVETAELAVPDLPIRRDARFRELSFGDWEGRTFDECARDFSELLARWVDDPSGVTPPNGERLADFTARVSRAVDDLLPLDSALVVVHGGPIRAILARVLGIDFAAAMRFQLDHAGITRLRWTAGGASCVTVNETAHLRAVSPVSSSKGFVP